MNICASQVEAKYEAADRATDWLRQRIERAARQGARGGSQDRRISHQESTWSNTEQNNPLTLQFFQLNTQLALAQAQRAEAEARLSRRVACSTPGGIASAVLVLNSPLMDSLRAQETELIRRLADMRSVYGENHPQMINARAELQSVRDKMLDEARRIIGDFENEVSVASAREKELQSNMSRLQDEAGRVDLAGAELSDAAGRGQHQPAAVRDLPGPLPRDRRAAGSAGIRRQDPVGGRSAQQPLASPRSCCSP